MMYCEFIDISEYGENYITFTEYHDYIEPIYMESLVHWNYRKQI